jgi:ferredoxin-thioredoxin reductase catalytic subunit
MTLEEIKANIKEGWQLNPNDKIVKGIMNGINRCNGDCPCKNDSVDKHCPCSNYREHDYCCCKLYLKL